MWTRIVGSLVVLIVISFAIQWMVPPSARGSRVGARQYLIWDIGPIIGFFSVVLLVLSLIEAARQGYLWAWAGGSALGLLASVVLWLAVAHTWRSRPITARREPVWRLAWRLVRTFGPVIVVLLVGLNLLTRWLGSVIEVFAAGAFGVCVVALTLLLLIEALRQNASLRMKEQRERNGK